MFPFTLTGPQFLLFYAVFGVVVLVIYRAYLGTLGGVSGSLRLTELTADPYKIALLRGDREEAVRVAVINLVDRGLLVCEGSTVRTAGESSGHFVRRPLDRAILECCASPQAPGSLVPFTQVRAALADYEVELESKGLLPDADQKRLRSTAFTVVLALLGGLAAARIVQALARGQTNLLFLLILVAVVGFIAFKISALRGTASGRQALASLETLTARVKRQVDRLHSGGATNEALLLAAVFGIYALPAAAFEFVDQLFPKPRPPQSGDRSSDGGGSCSSDSSAGSSCGGGSGCGGCGGGGD